jgi:hypothetical protein
VSATIAQLMIRACGANYPVNNCLDGESSAAPPALGPTHPSWGSFLFCCTTPGRLRFRPRLADLHTKDAIALKIQKPKNAVHAALSPNPQISPVIRNTEDIDPHSSSRSAPTPLALFSSTHCRGGPQSASTPTLKQKALDKGRFI